MMSHEYLRRASLTRHAETFKVAIFVQASAFVEARIAVTLIDVVLTPDNHSEYDCNTHCEYSKHLGPVYPVWQSHLKEPGVLTHLPPCSQGVPPALHSLMS